MKNDECRIFIVHHSAFIIYEGESMLLEATTTQTIIREISADLETPISVYMKLRGDGASFLLESVEGGERIARYSFIGVQPRAQYVLREGQVDVRENGESRLIQLD